MSVRDRSQTVERLADWAAEKIRLKDEPESGAHCRAIASHFEAITDPRVWDTLLSLLAARVGASLIYPLPYDLEAHKARVEALYGPGGWKPGQRKFLDLR